MNKNDLNLNTKEVKKPEQPQKQIFKALSNKLSFEEYDFEPYNRSCTKDNFCVNCKYACSSFKTSELYCKMSTMIFKEETDYVTGVVTRTYCFEKMRTCREMRLKQEWCEFFQRKKIEQV